MSLNFCANLSFMYHEQASLLDRYAQARLSGFEAVEFTFPYDYSVVEVQEAKEKAGVHQILINTYPGNLDAGELGFAALPGKEKEFRDSVDKAITYAKALNCGQIHVVAGIVESPTQEHDEVYKNNLRYAAEIFEKEKIVGLIEPVNRYSLPNYYMNSFQKAVQVIESVQKSSLKLQLDIFHLQLMNGDLTNNIKWLLPYSNHIQISQVPDRHEPDTAGEIDFAYIFELLRKLKYSGWIGLEYKSAGNTSDGLKWMKKEEFGLCA